MTQKTMVIDLDRCIGCFACEMACKQENNVPLGVHYNKVLSIGPMGKFPDLTQYFLPTVCQHCKDAPCVKVCPTGATYQTEDGQVLVNKEKCIGCKYCMMACPYGVRQFNEDAGVVQKCTLCAQITADGDGVQTLTVTITLAEYRRLAQQDGKLEYLQEQLDKKEEALTFMHQKSIEDDKAASNYRRQIEDLNRDRRNLAENANIVANAEQKTRESLERANARIEELTQDIIRVEKNRDAAWERFSEVSKQLDAAEASLKNKTLALTSLLNDLEALGVEPKKHNTEEEQK